MEDFVKNNMIIITMNNKYPHNFFSANSFTIQYINIPNGIDANINPPIIIPTISSVILFFL